MPFEGSEIPAADSKTTAPEPKTGEELLAYLRHLIQEGEKGLGDAEGKMPDGSYADAILDEAQIARDIQGAFSSFKISNDLSSEEDDTDRFLVFFDHLKGYSKQFEMLKIKTKSDLLTLRTQIYDEIRDEMSDYYQQYFSSLFKESAHSSLGALDDRSGVYLKVGPLEWQVYSNHERNRITRIEKDGKTFTFSSDSSGPDLSDSFGYLMQWQKQEAAIAAFNRAAPPQDRIDWTATKRVTLVSPHFWEIEQGGRTFMVTPEDVLVQKPDGRIFNPLEPGQIIAVTRDPFFNEVRIDCTRNGKLISERKLKTSSSSKEEPATAADGSALVKVTSVYFQDTSGKVFSDFYRLDESGNRVFVKQEVKGQLYGQAYTAMSQKEHLTKNDRPSEIGFEEGKRVGLLNIDPAWTSEEKERRAEQHLKELALKLDTPEKLAVFMAHFLSYVHDSPDPENPLREGLEEKNKQLEDQNFIGQYTQTALETVLRQKDGAMRGDCDDYATFAREILARNHNVCFVVTLGLPHHATCLWVQKSGDGYTAATLSTEGLNQARGKTIDEAYAKVLKCFEKPALGVRGEDTDKLDPNAKTIQVFYIYRHETTNRIIIPKSWLDPESKEGQLFFRLTRAYDADDAEGIARYAKALAELIPDNSAKRAYLEMAYAANIKLGCTRECLDFVAKWDSNIYQRSRDVAALIVSSNFAALDYVTRDPRFSDQLVSVFSDTLYYHWKKVTTAQAGLFFERVKSAEGIQKTYLYYYYAVFLMKKGAYKDAFDVLNKDPLPAHNPLDIIERNLLAIDPALAAQAVPKDMSKIEEYQYVLCFELCEKAHDPFAGEILMAVNRLVDTGKAISIPRESVPFMITYYEQQGDLARMLKLRQIEVARLEKHVQMRVENEGLSFGEIAAQDEDYTDLAEGYTALKDWGKLKLLHAARKGIEAHRQYAEEALKKPEELIEPMLGYIELSESPTRHSIATNFEWPSKLAGFSQREPLIDRIPIINLTKNPDPDGYFWAQISPVTKEESLISQRGHWMRLSKEEIKKIKRVS